MELARLPVSKPIHILKVWLWTHHMSTAAFARRLAVIRKKTISPTYLIRIMHGKAFASEPLAAAISEATKRAVGMRAVMNPEGRYKRALRKKRQGNRTRSRNRKRKGEYAKLIRIYMNAR